MVNRHFSRGAEIVIAFSRVLSAPPAEMAVRWITFSFRAQFYDKGSSSVGLVSFTLTTRLLAHIGACLRETVIETATGKKLKIIIILISSFNYALTFGFVTM